MIFNMVGGAGGGRDGAAILTVQAPINTDVTVSKDTKSYTKNSGTTGVVTFQGLTTGEWAVSISNELQTQTRTVTITTTYSVVIAFFTATINITYPAGSTCTVTKGSTVFTAPDTSGTWDCVVPGTGTWVVACTDGALSSSQNVSITADGQTESVTLAYFTATIAVTYPAGSTCSTAMGDITLNAPDTSGAWNCVVHYAGDWVFTCTDGSQSTTNTVTISTDGESKSLTLSYRLYLFSETDGNVGGFVVRNNFTIDSNFMKLLDGENSDASLNTWVDLSNYNTLYIDSIRTYAGTLTRGYISPSKSTTITEAGLNFGTSLTRKVESLDISAYSGSYNICIHGYWTVATIYNIWLE
jgi:hypothetical protein